MTRLLFYHDFTSPFCRLAAPVVAEAAAGMGLELRPVPFELRPAPAPLPALGDEPLAEELAAAREVAREWDLDERVLGTPSRVPRTRKAHEAVAHARAHGLGAEVLVALYHALWRDGLDISRLDVLADLGEAAGLDRQALHVALGLDEHEEEVVREQEAAVAAGITGVPAVQVGDALAVGLLPREELTAWIEEQV